MIGDAPAGQSTALFVLLVVVFGGLMWLMLVARRAAFRILAACLAFLPAMVFGVLAVNKYYGYYQTWGAVMADMSSQGVTAASRLPDVRLTSDPMVDPKNSGLSPSAFVLFCPVSSC